MVVNAEGRFAEGTVRTSFLVNGSTVVSNDYFKRLLAILRNIFGGRVKAYESLLDRARREAVLRMKDEAHSSGRTATRISSSEASCSRLIADSRFSSTSPRRMSH